MRFFSFTVRYFLLQFARFWPLLCAIEIAILVAERASSCLPASLPGAPVSVLFCSCGFGIARVARMAKNVWWCRGFLVDGGWWMSG